MGVGIIVIVVVFIALVVIGFFGYFIGIYNALVKVKNNIKKTWSNIDVLLKQRTDELPKLIASVKGYMKHEKSILTEVTKARTSVMNAKSVEGKAKASGQLTNALKTLFAVAENYPNLKANENFKQLQIRISGLENEIADRRELYNDSVNTYNIKIQQVPEVFIAKLMNMQEEKMFQVSDEDKKDVKVEF